MHDVSQNDKRTKEKLASDNIKANLMLSGVFLVAFELMKNSFIDDIKRFFVVGNDPHENDYRKEVLSLHKDKFLASALWLKTMNAINDDDVKKVKIIRNHRNKIAHELPALLTDIEEEIDMSVFSDLVNIYAKIEKWWVIEVEQSINPDFAGIDPETIKTGGMMLMNYLTGILVDEAIAVSKKHAGKDVDGSI